MCQHLCSFLLLQPVDEFPFALPKCQFVHKINGRTVSSLNESTSGVVPSVPLRTRTMKRNYIARLGLHTSDPRAIRGWPMGGQYWSQSGLAPDLALVIRTSCTFRTIIRSGLVDTKVKQS